MNIVLVSAGNLQEYIIPNIRQLLSLNHKSIYVLTNPEFFEKFNEFPQDIVKLISIAELEDSYNYSTTSTMTRDFRGGFWYFASARLFYIYSFMQKYQINDVIHLENDVPIYYNCDILLDTLDKNFMYLPFDRFDRNICSIIYIPNSDIFKQVLDRYDTKQNDMFNFSRIKQETNLINTFPICVTNTAENKEYQFVTKNYDDFKMIFDAAALGQYIGGVDPRNMPGDTRGYVSPDCTIKYNKFEVVWESVFHPETQVSLKKPFLRIGGNNPELVPVFNLHIHSKEVARWTGP